jgi:hypothetical protein
MKNGGLQAAFRQGMLHAERDRLNDSNGCAAWQISFLTPQAWQDDEWQVQDNHRDLGIAVGKASHVYNDSMLLHDDIISCRPAANTCTCVHAGVSRREKRRGERHRKHPFKHCK